MNIDIRGHIKNNFKTSNKKEFQDSIETTIKDKEELALPGLGVFFEIVWENSNIEEKNTILEKLKTSIN